MSSQKIQSFTNKLLLTFLKSVKKLKKDTPFLAHLNNVHGELLFYPGIGVGVRVGVGVHKC